MRSRIACTRHVALASVVAGSALALTACDAGQVAETSIETPGVAGVDAAVGPLLLDDVFLQSDTAIAAGASVPLRGAFTNTGQTNEQLTSLTTPAAAVQLLDPTGAPTAQGVEIPAGGQVDAVTGTVRLRLVDVTAPIPVTQLIPVTFVFGDGQQVTLDVPVSTPGAPSPSTSAQSTEVTAGPAS